MPSYVDQNLVSISASTWGPLLLSGPDSAGLPRPYPEYPLPGRDYDLPVGNGEESFIFESVAGNESLIIFLGHYNLPDYISNKLLLPGSAQLKLITHEMNVDERIEPFEEVNIYCGNNINNANKHLQERKQPLSSIGVQTDDNPEESTITDSKFAFGNISYFFPNTYVAVKQWVNQQENKGYKLMFIILFGCMISMFWYLKMQVISVLVQLIDFCFDLPCKWYKFARGLSSLSYYWLRGNKIHAVGGVIVTGLLKN